MYNSTNGSTYDSLEIIIGWEIFALASVEVLSPFQGIRKYNSSQTLSTVSFDLVPIRIRFVHAILYVVVYQPRHLLWSHMSSVWLHGEKTCFHSNQILPQVFIEIQE